MSSRDLPGRGTTLRPQNRFEELRFEADPDPEPLDEDEAPLVQTTYYRDATRTVLAENKSPDIPFRFSLNPYRGCAHGCIYCYARPSHEYLGFDAGLGFETQIMVKDDAPELLRATFRSARWQPQVVALSGNTDCYQPIERRLGITRRCLQVFAEFRNPVGVITKSALVARDKDLLAELAGDRCAQVRVSITTLDPDLARRMEPRAATPSRRLEAIAALASAGVPTGVMVAPIIPGLNDSEIPAILRAAAEAGARTASWVLLRLAPPNDVLFVEWLDRHLPLRRDKVLHRIRETRSGRISDSAFGRRMRGQGEYARQIAALFEACARRHHLGGGLPELDPGRFRLPPEAGDQLALL
jgi:DNA repair photolyase